MSEKVITYNNLAEFKNKADEKYQDRLTAGTGITIDENNVISAQGGGGGGSYEGVSPIVVDNDAGTIGADTVQMKFQQITHDDTLVHMASDSNYALGVNIDLLKRLMGVDETVLFDTGSDTRASSGTLTEAYTNFDRLLLEVGFSEVSQGITYQTVSTRSPAIWIIYGLGASGPTAYYAGVKLIWKSPTSFSVDYGSAISHAETSTSVSGYINENARIRSCVYRIIGIGRKGGN